MDELAGIAELYIRSLGSRRTTDGLADNLPEMLDAMDDFGFDEVLLETVGVGQAEYAARMHVDTLVLVLLPDSGDTVQAMRSEEHTSELQSLMRISYAVFCLKKKKKI